jgi:integrase/recombinase XerD
MPLLKSKMSELIHDFFPIELKLISPLPLTLHPALVYLDSLGSGSQLTMANSLNTIASILTEGECDLITLDWSKLRYRHTSVVRSVLGTRYSPTTANKMLSGLRRVLQTAFKLDLIDQADYVAAVDLADFPTNGKLRGRALTSAEIFALMSSCSGERTIDVRDRAIIAILRGAGLRRAELVNLNLADYLAEKLRLDIRNAKGGKDRMVYLPSSAISLVNQWLEKRGYESGPLIYGVSRGGKIIRRRLSTDGVLKIVRARASKAGISSFSPHDFRRTFCSDLLDAGVDIVTVQRLAGHASPMTTAKYDRRGEETKLKAVQNLGF